MSRFVPEYGTGLQRRKFEFAHHVCVTEANAGLELKRAEPGFKWDGQLAIFGAELALHSVIIEYPYTHIEAFHIRQFRLKVDGYEATYQLGDPEPNPAFVAMDEDILQTAVEVYEQHEHDSCIIHAQEVAEQHRKDYMLIKSGR